MQITDYHARYYAWELLRRRAGDDVGRIGGGMVGAQVDLNPHQIEAAIFALRNPLAKGVLLADEVGLGKTVEAALVLSQYWAERKRRLIVLCPASLRQQWASELQEKFGLPTQILDTKTWNTLRKEGVPNPLSEPKVHILSLNWAARMAERLQREAWDLAIIDEAHKLRNAHRESHRTGQAIKQAFAGTRKILLSATPLQNSLLELFGLSTVLDEHLFGDRTAFQRQYIRDNDIPGLRDRLNGFTHRTLRKDVLEYIRYTERRALTIPFTPSEEEQQLYDLVSAYLAREETYGFPIQQRHLIALVLRKLLASSTQAVIATLEAILQRLKALRDDQQSVDDWLDRFIDEEDIDEDILDELQAVESEAEDDKEPVDLERLNGEIAELQQYIALAHRIDNDEKSRACLQAIEQGFSRMAEMGAARKAVIFTESRRTQDYLAAYLERNGHAGRVVCFSGKNASETIRGIYQAWLQRHAGSDRVTGSAAIDKRTALIDHFRESADILIGTEAAAEGINLQFCSLVINYDLPWNPQRVEQRIGRCHRYGQQHDVVVINFINQRNAADRRVLELLTEKFRLFDGLFGASDQIIGRIESGVDIERRIARIYDECRDPETIEAAFNALQKELEDSINEKMRETEQQLLEHFDQNIHERLKLQREQAAAWLDRHTRLFWWLSRHLLHDKAAFDDTALRFSLTESPVERAPIGPYQLGQPANPKAAGDCQAYRLSHPLGEWVLQAGQRLATPDARISFDLSSSEGKISVLEALRGQSGWLQLNLLELQSFALEEHLVFTAVTEQDEWLPGETTQKLFELSGTVESGVIPALPVDFQANAQQQITAALNQALENNNQWYQAERDKLEAWAEDQEKAAQAALDDTKSRIKATKRAERQAQTVAERKQEQESIQKLEKQLRRQRQEIFAVEDEIGERRDALIAALDKQLNQKSGSLPLFTIHWTLR